MAEVISTRPGADIKKARKSEPGKISVARCTGFEPVT
ncbi:hypothetical protein EC09BKT78844_3055, partial [Escherichia coli 09BKT078844]